MNIHEYQAKDILRQSGIAVPDGVVILSINDIENIIQTFGKKHNVEKYAIKAQIYAGGRGKAGGVKICNNVNSAIETVRNMFGTTLTTNQTTSTGQKITRIYVEKVCNIKNEYYLSLLLDRAAKCITLVGSSVGGVGIEEVAKQSPDKIIKVHINPITGLSDFHYRTMYFALGLPQHIQNEFSLIIKILYNLVYSLDATQIEINPIVLTDENKLMLLDAKFNIDDNALYRHNYIKDMLDQEQIDPLEYRAKQHDLNYVGIGNGNIGCIVNGAGLAMATMDIIQLYGGTAANFLDIGGGANKERMITALEIVLSNKNVKVILINIFGGIIHCDIVAQAIIDAMSHLKFETKLIVRLEGTNHERGREIFSQSQLNIISAENLVDAVQKAISAC